LSGTAAKEAIGVFGKKEDLKRVLRCRSFTSWALLLVTMLGLCVLWAPVSAAEGSNERCQAFAQKLEEIRALDEEALKKHLDGNEDFAEGKSSANLKYRNALSLDTTILNKINELVSTFGVTPEVKAKLDKAKQQYSQKVDAYTQYTQLMAQAGMGYRINQSMGDRLHGQANSVLESSNQFDDKACTLLEEAGELLCKLTEQVEKETVPQTSEAPTTVTLSPFVGDVLEEECPECPSESGGSAETTSQGIEIQTTFMAGVTSLLLDKVTDCETGGEIDATLLGTEFVFTSGAKPPYDLTDLDKVIVKAEGYEDTAIRSFTPMQFSLVFFQVTALVPDEADICLYKKTPCCRCLKRLPAKSKVQARVYTTTNIYPSKEGEFGAFVKEGTLIGEVQLSKSTASSTPERITVPTVPHKTAGSRGEVILEVTGASLACHTCPKGSRSVPCTVKLIFYS